MPANNQSKVAVDSEIQEYIPTVAVAPPYESPFVTEKPAKKHKPVTFVGAIVGFFMDFLETIVVALSIFVIVYLFLVQPHEVKGSSMEPSFHNNEYILTDKISYRFHEPDRGDVIIFKAPRNPEVDYIKRIIGLPGERIMIEEGEVLVNGENLNEPYIIEQTVLFPGSMLEEGVEIPIPRGQYFVMGDNRSHSSDSREFGPIDRNLIIGRAFM